MAIRLNLEGSLSERHGPSAVLREKITQGRNEYRSVKHPFVHARVQAWAVDRCSFHVKDGCNSYRALLERSFLPLL